MKPGRVDLVLGAVAFGVTLVFTLWDADSSMGVPASLGVAALTAVAVAASGSRPAWGLALILVVACLTPAWRLAVDAYPLVVALVCVQAVRSDAVPLWLVAASGFTCLTVYDVWQRENVGDTYRDPSVLLPLLVTAVICGFGVQTRRVRRQNAQLRELRDLDRRRAVSDERRRIARDVHDVAAHHLSALVVRSKLALRDDDAATMRDTVAFAASTSQEALDSLRRVVTVLDSDPGRSYEPQPTLSELGAVVEHARAAGLAVESDVEDGIAPSREVQVAVVRIAQEALANVLRHRGPGPAWLTLSADRGILALCVEDDGPDTWTAAAGSPDFHRPGGSGLVGMRERVVSCAGTIDVGPSPRGGWRVRAELPL